MYSCPDLTNCSDWGIAAVGGATVGGAAGISFKCGFADCAVVGGGKINANERNIANMNCLFTLFNLFNIDLYFPRKNI
ncbi:MAG: hypothetical protein CMH75_06490 [Nitrospina sp.]|nr:hypothetical protein [Nitrospina sp.]